VAEASAHIVSAEEEVEAVAPDVAVAQAVTYLPETKDQCRDVRGRSSLDLRQIALLHFLVEKHQRVRKLLLLDRVHLSIRPLRFFLHFATETFGFNRCRIKRRYIIIVESKPLRSKQKAVDDLDEEQDDGADVVGRADLCAGPAA